MDGLILAGGKSRRMKGRHKGDLKIGDETFAERLIRELKKDAENIWISYGDEIRVEYPGCRIVMDEHPGCGPIGGIHAGLKKCFSDKMMVAACDMPFLEMELYRYLHQMMGAREWETGKCVDGVIPFTREKMHPLAAIYRKSAAKIFEEQIQNGNYRVTDTLKRLNILYVDVTGKGSYEKMLRNINTILEYDDIRFSALKLRR